MVLFRIVLLFLLISATSCSSINKITKKNGSSESDNTTKKDNTDLYAKSAAVDEIIKRSGTALTLGQNEKANERALRDAENRLRTGGGLFGKKSPTINSLLGNKEEKVSYSNIGMPVNAILWKSSLEVLDFMPFASIDAFSGTIITDWYIGDSKLKERCKLNVFIKGKELKTENLKVNSFCQKFDNDIWIDTTRNIANDQKIENAILNKAKKIRLSFN